MKSAKAVAVDRQFALVYQTGVANVFEFLTCGDGVNLRHRVMQGAFSTCEAYAAGLMEMGATMHVHFCNKAGDIAQSDWDTGIDNAPFTDSMHPRFRAMAVGSAVPS